MGMKFVLIILILHSLAIHTGFCDTPSSSDSKGEDCKKDTDGFCSSDKDKQESCTLTPQSSEGPFFLPNQPIRSNITEGRPGIPLIIDIIVRDLKTCKTVKGATVHMWHADAMGIYSAYSGYYPLGEPGSIKIVHPHSPHTDDATFLRGIQISDDSGKATFKTIYPGWYKYRPLHIHFKITIGTESKYTGEIYYPDELTDKVALVEPYSKHTELRLKNRDDYQFIKDGGEALVMKTTGNVKDGLQGSMDVVIDLTSND